MTFGLKDEVPAAATTWHDFVPVSASYVATEPTDTSTRRTGTLTKFRKSKVCEKKTILRQKEMASTSCSKLKKEIM